MTRVILAHHSEDPGRLLDAAGDKDNGFIWIYLGRDYRRALEWKKRMPQNAVQAEAGRDLQVKAAELRRPFIDFMSTFGPPSLDGRFTYWSSLVFEKNTVISPLFLYCCYLEVLKGLLEKNKEHELVVVISESWSFLNAVRDNASLLPVKLIYIENRVNRFSDLLGDYIRAAGSVVTFVVRCFIEYCMTRMSRPRPQKTEESGQAAEKQGRQRLIILRTWVFASHFDKDLNFKNAYLPGIGDWLKHRGFKVKNMPVTLVPGAGLKSLVRSYKELAASMRKPGNEFLMPWDYLRPRDVFTSLRLCLGQIGLKIEGKAFGGWNVDALLRKEKRRFTLDSRGLGCMLYYLFFKRLAKSGMDIERIIYTFENMLTEKLFLLGAKEFYPGAKTIGFQHSVLYPLKLDMFMSEDEMKSAVMPDKIVCSGPGFREILVRESYPAFKLDTGPALRFAHVFERKKRPADTGEKRVLMVCPGYQNELIELLFKTLSALRDDDVSVWVKPKPGMIVDAIMEEMTRLSGIDPVKIKMVSGPLSDLMEQADLMVTIASGAIVDGIAAGIPVLRVKRESDLDLDPMDWLRYDRERDFIAYNIEDIKKEVGRALSMSAAERERLVLYGRKFVEEFFSPITEDGMNVFLN